LHPRCPVRRDGRERPRRSCCGRLARPPRGRLFGGTQRRPAGRAAARASEMPRSIDIEPLLVHDSVHMGTPYRSLDARGRSMVGLVRAPRARAAPMVVGRTRRARRGPSTRSAPSRCLQRRGVEVRPARGWSPPRRSRRSRSPRWPTRAGHRAGQRQAAADGAPGSVPCGRGDRPQGSASSTVAISRGPTR